MGFTMAVNTVNITKQTVIATKPAVQLEADVKGNRYTILENEKANRNWFEATKQYLDTTNGGAFRLGQLGNRFFHLLNLVAPRQGFDNLSKMFRGMWTVTV